MIKFLKKGQQTVSNPKIPILNHLSVTIITAHIYEQTWKLKGTPCGREKHLNKV